MPGLKEPFMPRDQRQRDTTGSPPAQAENIVWETYMDAGRQADGAGNHAEAERLLTLALAEAEKFDPLDPRLVTLVITDNSAFGGQGQAYVPVLAFAGFYITGWDSPGACADNAPYPSLGNSDAGDVWGHFVNYVVYSAGGTPSPIRCNFTSTNVCIAVLTQ